MHNFTGVESYHSIPFFTWASRMLDPSLVRLREVNTHLRVAGGLLNISGAQKIHMQNTSVFKRKITCWLPLKIFSGSFPALKCGPQKTCEVDLPPLAQPKTLATVPSFVPTGRHCKHSSVVTCPGMQTLLPSSLTYYPGPCASTHPAFLFPKTPNCLGLHSAKRNQK